jgi:hypothetical protein
VREGARGRGIGEVVSRTYTAWIEVMAPDIVLEIRSSSSASSVPSVGW